MDKNKYSFVSKFYVVEVLMTFVVLIFGFFIHGSAQAQGVMSGQASQNEAPNAGQDSLSPSDIQLKGKSLQVAKILLEAKSDKLLADGVSPLSVEIQLFDSQGKLVEGDAWVRVAASGQMIYLPKEFEKMTQHNEINQVSQLVGLEGGERGIKIVNGKGLVYLIAPLEPRTIFVRVMADATDAQKELYFAPNVRPMIVAGLVEGIVSFNRGRGKGIHLSQAQASDGFEQEIKRWSRSGGNHKTQYGARAALFLKGKVLGSDLLTLSYDSDKPRDPKTFGSIDENKWYPVYGDASVITQDARSDSPLYVRLDHEKSFLLYGDYNTAADFSQLKGTGAVANLNLRELGSYSRSLTGGRAHYETEDVVANIYAARDNLRQVVDEFPALGLSGPYGVKNSREAIQGTEKVEIIVRDRNQPSVILSVTPKLRTLDYVFEPFSGRLLFKSAVPSLDAQLNPISIRVTYEIVQGGEKFWVYGADIQGKYGPVGGGVSYARDKNPLRAIDYQLASANVNFTLSSHTAGVFEVARSRGASQVSIQGQTVGSSEERFSLNGAGNAYRFELNHQSDDWRARVFFGDSQRSFDNPNASLRGGRREIDAKVEYRVNDVVAVRAQDTYSKDKFNGASRNNIYGGVDWKINPDLEFSLGIRHVKEKSGNGSSSYGLTTDAPWRGLSGLNANTTTYGWPSTVIGVPVSYTAPRVAVRYRISEKARAGAEYEHAFGSQHYQRYAIDADYSLNNSTRAYGRYEWNTGLNSLGSGIKNGSNSYRSSAFIAGIDATPVAGTNVFSEYRFNHANLGERNTQWANGIKNTWNVNDRWIVTGAAEHLVVMNGSGQAATSLSGGFSWRPNDFWTVNSLLELRRNYGSREHTLTTWQNGKPVENIIPRIAGSDSVLNTLTIAKKLNQSWTILGRNYLLFTRERSNKHKNTTENRFQFGLAYRDDDYNRVNALVKYEYWLRNEHGNVATDFTQLGYQKHILAGVADYQPTYNWWSTGRLAFKWQRNRFAGKNYSDWSAILLSGRSIYDIDERFDIGVLGAVMKGLTSQDKSTYYAVGAEVGYRMATNTWLSLGYNFRGFSADDMTNSEYTQQGVYLRIRMKFDENLFGGR